ncbi:hypothetical protein SGFS_098640 [Streptomyces graminofaciens]|uniref:Uncharacterized protein n=1 Tax=Streptomyces graminofaciens TaxID=68212 RepID=A0ABN5W1J9_9ACTN|nr:hypothetical protein SGFS_098640 [Streptomyces graminofaciens]
MTTDTIAPAIPDLSDPATFASAVPHQALDAVRQLPGLYWQPTKAGTLNGGFWCVTRHADIIEIELLTHELQDAAAHFGDIDVLPYSPVGRFDTTALTSPTSTEPSRVEFEMNFQLYGAITATKAPRCARPARAPSSTPPAPGPSSPTCGSQTSTSPPRRCATAR